MTPEEFFEDLLPAIEENVQNNDMLVPVLVVQLNSGERLVKSMHEFFREDCGNKDAILPIIELLLKPRVVDMIALVAECYIAEVGKSVDVEEFRKSGKQVKDVEGAIDGVMVSIYCREGEDTMFSLAIEEGRKGVRRLGEYERGRSEGRFVREKRSE